MAYNPIFVTLSSLKPFFVNDLQNEFRFSDTIGTSDLRIHEERSEELEQDPVPQLSTLFAFML